MGEHWSSKYKNMEIPSTGNQDYKEESRITVTGCANRSADIMNMKLLAVEKAVEQEVEDEPYKIVNILSHKKCKENWKTSPCSA